MNKSEKIRRWYGIFLAIFTAIVGVVFIAQIAELYYSGISEGLDVIYTTERLSSRLILPIVFLCLWIAAIIAGFVLSVVFPIKEKHKICRDDDKTLRLLKARMPEEGESEEFALARENISKLERARIIVWCLTTAVLLCYGIYIMVYVFDPSHFHSNRLREDVIVLVRNLIAFVIIGLALCITAVIHEHFAVRYEVKWVKRAIASGDKNSVPTEKGLDKNGAVIFTIILAAISMFAVELLMLAPFMMTWILNSGDITGGYIALVGIFFLILIIAGYALYKTVRKHAPERSVQITRLFARIAVLTLAAAFIVAGIMNSGAAAVLTKAVNICTECIGLG